MKRTRMMLAAVVGLVLIVASAPAAAPASEGREPVDPQIVQLLKEVPGGVLIDGDHAVWPELDMEFTAAGAAASSGVSARAVGSCATGRICAYSAYNLGGSILSWASCGNIAIPSSFAARSVANARTSGYLNVRNGASVVATVSANSWGNVYSASNNILCYL